MKPECHSFHSLLYRYVKFDTFHPAVDRGLPVTRVISRFVLQKLLAEACERAAGGDFVIQNDSIVCDYEEKVSFVLFLQARIPSGLSAEQQGR